MRKSLLLLLVACTPAASIDSADLALTAKKTVSSPDVSIIVGPTDKGQGLINAINSAQQSVHVLMYLLSDEGVINAIVGRTEAGLDVRVVLNKSVPNGVDNTRSFQCLKSRNVDVVWAPDAFNYNHGKTVILDKKTSWIMTMNAAKSSLINNREFLAVDTTPSDVAENEAVFEADYAGIDYQSQGALVVAPINARERILDLVNTAQNSVDVCAQQLTDAKFVSALCAARARGVSVRAMTDGDIGETQLRVVRQLAQCDVPVYTLDELYVHAKALVADGKRAYVGSVNYTRNSMDNNREVGIITSNPSAVATIANTINDDISVGRFIGEPIPCASPSDCASGSACLNKFCQQWCSNGSQCNAGEICVLPKDSSFGSCQAPNSCATVEECGRGLVCNGSCAHCTSNEQCSTGFCDRTLCRNPIKKCTEDPTVCRGSTPACDLANAKCVGCNEQPDFVCAAGTTCITDYCDRGVGSCRGPTGVTGPS